MSITSFSSKVTMPFVRQPYPSIIDFLTARFPGVSRTVWLQRIQEGKVFDDLGTTINEASKYIPHGRLHYFREVADEVRIPFKEIVLYRNDHLLVACKPHFLPVTPGGCFVNECLLNRLRSETGIDDLVPIHRIDRETAGIVLFSTQAGTRRHYCDLFMNGNVRKTYQAVSRYTGKQGKYWKVDNRIVKGDPWFRMTTVTGISNSSSDITLDKTVGDKAYFTLHPATGKTHQLRIHMSGIGYGILNDRLYPDLQPFRADDYAHPLQLLAKKIEFRDPITNENFEFTSTRELYG